MVNSFIQRYLDEKTRSGSGVGSFTARAEAEPKLQLCKNGIKIQVINRQDNSVRFESDREKGDYSLRQSNGLISV